MRPLHVFLNAHGRMRKAGNGWRGSCPACNTSARSVALSVAEGDSGILLVKCLAGGCEPEAICNLLGLELSDLFPPSPECHTSGRPARRRLLTAGQALDLLESESMLVVVCASDMARGETLDERTRERLRLGAARISLMRQEVAA